MKEAIMRINKHGQGVFKWASGDYYQGLFEDDKRHGYGEMYWNDGSIYKGHWNYGVQSGHGLSYTAAMKNYVNHHGEYDVQRDRCPNPSKIIDNQNDRAIPMNHKIRIEKSDHSDGMEASFNDNSSGDFNSGEYSSYESELQK